MDTYQALADDTRRSILEMLAQGELSAGTIAAAFPVSRPAISRHLRVLRESGLVSVRGERQQRLYRLDPGPLQEVQQWTARYSTFWGDRLDRLEDRITTNDTKETT
jgi:DNA-binding transcriptional ArsR family regulator